jgi:L,D-peptidoglycan transpeptidase YkuD (ErfK/YbiS/YcfS/YnhG family)
VSLAARNLSLGIRPAGRALRTMAMVALACLAFGGVPLAPALAAPSAAPLPAQMAATGDGTQLVTVVANGRSNRWRTGVATWWSLRAGAWVKVGSAPARFGFNGLSAARREGDGTTPTGLFELPSAFGIRPDPGTGLPWQAVDAGSWWDENADDPGYNTWYEDCPPTVCWTPSTRRTRASEHLVDARPQYDYAVVIGFNTGTDKVRPPARPSGSGIFLHVNGPGYTAGCVSLPRTAMVAMLRWLKAGENPHVAIGNQATIRTF